MDDLVSLDDCFSQVRFKLLLDPTRTLSVPLQKDHSALMRGFLGDGISSAQEAEMKQRVQIKTRQGGRGGKGEKKGGGRKTAVAPVRNIPSCKIKHDFYFPGAPSCIIENTVSQNILS